MSRLDSHIRRLQAQRDCLNAAQRQVAAVPGVVFELGFGNGRTYDHLRALFPGREIYVFERWPSPHKSSVPDEEYLVAGDVLETLPAMCRRFRGRVALIHNDLGVGDAERDTGLTAALAPHVAEALAPGALVVTQDSMDHPALKPRPLPDGVAAGRYLIYARAGAAAPRPSTSSG